MKYRQLASHADAKAPKGRMVSNYPPKKKAAKAVKKAKKGY
jgi:hypothetical protein